MRHNTQNRMFDPRRVFSPHFRLHEFTKSATASKYQLHNAPREECELANLRALATEVLEPARAMLGVPLVIASGYRCATLNRLVGGAPQSQHMLGEAADFIPKNLDIEEAAGLLVAQPALPFDQLIYEVRERENAAPLRWIHISHRRFGKGRREVLSILRTAAGQQVLPGVQGSASFSAQRAPENA